MVAVVKSTVEIVAKVYKPIEGSRLTAKEADTIGRGLEIVNQRNPDGILPEDVVDDARRPDSLLHPYFEWNDRIAAQSYRIEQARHLMRSVIAQITLRHRNGREETREIRAWLNVTVENLSPATDKVAERRYVDVVTVANTPDYRQEVIERAERELNGWMRRYDEYQSLPEFSQRFAPVIAAIKALP